MRDNKLVELSEVLRNKFKTKFLQDNILEVCSGQTPIAFLIVEREKLPDHVIISTALDFINVQEALDLGLTIANYAQVALAEPFYISKDGITRWDEDAYNMFELENDGELLSKVEPVSNWRH